MSGLVSKFLDLKMSVEDPQPGWMLDEPHPDDSEPEWMLDQANPDVKVRVHVDEQSLYQFRHATELNKEAKGGYLAGDIKIHWPEHLHFVIEKIVITTVNIDRTRIHFYNYSM